MRFSKLLLSAAILLPAAPAIAGIVVLGASSARSCYLAAEAPGKPSLDQLEQCNRALSMEPLLDEDIVATHVNRGILLLRRGQVEPALQDFDRAIALDPNEPEAYLNKGAAFVRSGRAEAALPLFEVALQKKTSKPALAYYARGVANEDLGRLQAAYQDYRKASETDPKWKVPRRELLRFKTR